MAELRRMTYNEEEYVLAHVGKSSFVVCEDCPFFRERMYKGKPCPWDARDAWAPEYHCQRGTWVPIVLFMKNQLAGE